MSKFTLDKCICSDWNGKPYHSLDYEMKRSYHKKIYKLALDGGMSCPNRDGTIGYGGCIFCSEGGSGDFAISHAQVPDVHAQIELAKEKVMRKMSSQGTTSASGGSFIAYFQSYTNTYAPVEYLRELFTASITHPDIVALSIGTRPDCLAPDVVSLLIELNQIKPVWIELGLQTIHEDTARLIHRGYELPCFEDAYHRLKDAGLTVIVHVILGLPGETRAQMLETVQYLGDLGIDGIKLQLLHILKGTALATMYETDSFPVMDLEEYLDLVLDCISLLPPEIVIHRITGDGPKSLLLAPLWSANKRLVLNSLTRRLKERGVWQGCRLSQGTNHSASLTVPSSCTVTPKEIPVM